MQSNAKNIALCGLMAALAFVLMLLGSLIGIGTYMAPLLAGILLTPVGERLGTKWHIMLIVVTAVLSFLFLPDTEESLMFAVFFGWYPIVRAPLTKIHPKAAAIAVKLLIFNVCIVASEALLMLVLVPTTEAWWMLLLLLALGNLVFLLYDHALPQFTGALNHLLNKIK